MTKSEVLKLLKEHQNERGVAYWQKLGPEANGLKSFGIGLTRLRKLAKGVGRDHKLAQQLWKSEYYDARVMGILIDDPKEITREQVEQQVEDLNVGMLSHVYASCDAPLSKAPFVKDLAKEWVDNKDDMRRRCGYLLLYELSKDKKKKSDLDDDFFLEYIRRIRDSIVNEENWVKDAMNVALMGIGKRNLKLNQEAIKVAKNVGRVDVDYGDDNSCEPLEVLKHLTVIT
jgi:3-methyladenine DNA glycosylase AlkD